MRVAPFVFVLVVAGLAHTARADAPPPSVVHLFVVGTDRDKVQPLVDVFSRHDSNLRLTHVPVFCAADVMTGDERGVAARVWIEVAAGGRARITITDQRAQRFLVREAVLPTWPDELARETIAQMVESSVAALLENQGLGMTRSEAHSVLAAHDDRPAPPPGSEHQPSLGAFYQAQIFSPQILIAHGPGLRGQVTTPTRIGPAGLAASAQYVLPQSRDDVNAGVRLHGVALRLGVGLSGQGTRLRLAAWLGAGVDTVHVQPQQGRWGVATLTAARWTAVTVLRAELRAGLHLAKKMALFLTPSLEWDPLKRAYNVTGVDGQAAVVAPYTVRPSLSLAVEWQ
ncbi:MAG TPA: hypothetical protein VF518_08075 [Polyangia bacterium]